MAADLFYLFVVSVEDDVTSRAEENPGMKKKKPFSLSQCYENDLINYYTEHREVVKWQWIPYLLE